MIHKAGPLADTANRDQIGFGRRLADYGGISPNPLAAWARKGVGMHGCGREGVQAGKRLGRPIDAMA